MRRGVLHFIDTTGPGGAETVFLQVADGLRARGWDSHTVVVGPGWVLDSIRTRQLPVDVLTTSGRFDVRFARDLIRIIRTRRIRLIHAHLFSPAVYASLVGALTRVPVVASFHGDSDIVSGGIGLRMRYRIIDHQSRCVCVSPALRDRLSAMGLVRDSRVSVIHNGVDTLAFAHADGRRVRREHGVRDDAVLIGAVGNVRPAKDYFTLLRTAAELAKDSRFVFAIAGERTEPLFSELVALRDELGLAGRVSFWGFRDDIADVIAAFDVLAVSSSTEGFSLAAVQAMAAGTPVVATRSGGPETILTDGTDGLLVPIHDPSALAAGIRRLADDRALRTNIVERARRTARDRFSIAGMLDAYEALYLSLIRR